MSIIVIVVSIVSVVATILNIKFDAQHNYIGVERTRTIVAICLLIMFAILILMEIDIVDITGRIV